MAEGGLTFQPYLQLRNNCSEKNLEKTNIFFESFKLDYFVS